MSTDNWTLLIKTMHQSIQSVTVPRSASVLQLKDAIRLEFDIANDRQRLIFQGKVLKDGTQLTDYSNLEDGKIIHLVARPADAPTNPVNDEPPTSQPRGTMPQMFPGMFGPSEGYTFITLDANISDLGGSNSPLSSLFGGLLGGSPDRNGRMNGPMNTRTQFTFSRPSQGNQVPSTLRNWLNRRQPGEFSSLLDTTTSHANTSSVESRLIRTIAALTNLQTNLDAPPTETDAPQIPTPTPSPAAIRTIQSELRTNGSNDMAQVGYTVNNMSDVLDAVSARLRQVGNELQEENASYEQLAPRLQHAVASMGYLNTVNQFVGDIMNGLAPPQRRNLRSSTRSRSQQSNPTSPSTRRTGRSSDRSSPNLSNSSSPSKRSTRSATTASTSTSTSNKRKARSNDTPNTGTSSSTSKRQKSNKNNSETGASSTSSPTTKKGKGKRRADDN